MTKINEIKKHIDDVQKSLDKAFAEEQYDDVKKFTDELQKANIELNAAVAMENAEMAKFNNVASFATGGKAAKDSAMENRIFNKRLLGRQLDVDEQEYVNAIGTTGQVEGVDARGGYLVPEEQMNILREYRNSYTELKSYCNIHIAQSNAGKMPTLGAENGTLTSFDEISTINQTHITFGQLTYSITDYGDIIPVSNQLLQDSAINVMEVIGRRFARRAVNTENAAIIAQLPSMATATAVTGYKDFMKALNVSLDPIYWANAKIFTNQDGLQWLSELSDAQNRPLLVPDVAAPDTFRFRGKEVVVLSNNTLPSKAKEGSTNGHIPFYVGSMADYMAFFDRLGVELAVSAEAGFDKYTTLIRAVERFGVVADDTSALKAYKVVVTA